jgi:uncharacterized protein YjiK
MVAVWICACTSPDARPVAPVDPLLPWVAAGPSVGLPDIWTNLSGIDYDAERRSYLLVENNGRRIYEYEEDLQSLRRIVRLAGARNFDFEGIAVLGGGRVALANEKNQLTVFRLPAEPGDEPVSLDPNDGETGFVQLPAHSRWNQGIEGLCFDRNFGAHGALYAFQESSPRRVFRVRLGEEAELLDFEEPFDAERRLEGVLLDLSGCAVDPADGSLLLLSHRSSRLSRVAPDGRVLASMDLPGRRAGGASQWEGVALGPDRQLVLVSEPFFGTWPSRLQIYREEPLRQDSRGSPR